MKAESRFFWPKVGLVVFLIFIFIVIATFPGRSYNHLVGRRFPRIDNIAGFSGIEKHPDGYKFQWALPEATLTYYSVPRYSPLDINLKLNLGRPAAVLPARIDVYESTVTPPGEPRYVTTIEFKQGDSGGPRDYPITIPANEEGQGLNLELQSNTFKPKGDSRQLGFLFLGANLSMPETSFMSLFWPEPYLEAGLLLVAALAAWSLSAGLGLFETLLLAGLSGFTIVTIVYGAYKFSWLLLLIAVGVWAAYWWERRMEARGRWSFWPLLSATTLLLLYFMFSSEEHFRDIKYYRDWTTGIHDNGIWNIYNYTNSRSLADNNFFPLDYLPLVVYVIALRNLVVYPLGLANNNTAWRFTAALMFLAVVIVLFLILKVDKDQSKPPKLLLLVALNTGIFYNATNWGQLDMMAVLVLVTAFYFIYRRQNFLGGLTLGLVVISKPQAWFVLPLLGWMLVQRCGWKRALQGGAAGLVLVAGLSAVPFGMDIGALERFFFQPEMLGEVHNNTFVVFNLNYLLLGTQPVDPPTWIAASGFIVITVVVLLVMLGSTGRNRSLKIYGFGGGLLVTTCFTWLIKMKERYLVFGLPFLGLAAIKDKKFVKPFLLLSWIQLVQLVISIHWFQQVQHRRLFLYDAFQLWTIILRPTRGWITRGISMATVLLSIYLIGLYAWEIYKERCKLSGSPALQVPQLEASVSESV